MQNKPQYKDEIVFVDLLKRPISLYGWVFIYFLIAAVFIGVFYLRNLDDIARNEAPMVNIEKQDVRRQVELAKGGIVPAMDLNKIKSPDAEFISKGKELYDQNCASCHGSKGMGDGAAGAALNPQPRNFHNTDGWTNGREFTDLYRTLQEGIIQNGMAAYEYIPVEDRVAIIHYVRTFAEFPEVTEDMVVELDATYNLSAGTVKPNTIPVAKAMNIIENEEGKLAEKVKYCSLAVRNAENKNRVFVNNVYDCSKVFKSVLTSDISDDVELFKEAVSNDPETLGFKSAVVTLNNDEWNDLFNYVNDVIDQAKS